MYSNIYLICKAPPPSLPRTPPSSASPAVGYTSILNCTLLPPLLAVPLQLLGILSYPPPPLPAVSLQLLGRSLSLNKLYLVTPCLAVTLQLWASLIPSLRGCLLLLPPLNPPPPSLPSSALSAAGLPQPAAAFQLLVTLPTRD